MSEKRDDETEGHHSLVMPFVAVTSEGGPYDDASFVAGFQMGALDEELKLLKALGAEPRPRYIATALVVQADLIAMRHGFSTKATPWDEHPDEWTRIDFYVGDTPDAAAD